MTKLPLFLCAALLTATRPSAATTVLSNVAEIAASVRSRQTQDVPFDLRGICVHPHTVDQGCRIVIQDDTGAVPLYRRSPYTDSQRAFDKTVAAGDVLHLQGNVQSSPLSGLRLAHYKEAEILKHGPAPAPIEPTGRALASGEADFRLVRVRGKVIDVFNDEADPNYIHLQLLHDGETILLPHLIDPPVFANDRHLVGFDITAVGICEPSNVNSRRHIGRTLACDGDADIRLTRPPTFDLFDEADIAELYALQPERIVRSGWHRAEGRVLAAWNGRHLLLQADKHHVVRVDLADEAAPASGEFVEVAGIPSTDIFHVNLTRAVWRPRRGENGEIGEGVKVEGLRQETTIRQLQMDAHGERRFANKLHGRVVRTIGLVRSVRTDAPQPSITVEDGEFAATVNFIGLAETLPEIGSRVAITGVCVMEAADWRPNLVFPQIHDFHIAMRTSDDLAVLAPPPWWTPRRLTVAICVLLLGLAAITVWNVSLRLLAERRGKELFRERAERFGAVQRTNERTRIAVELHDSLSQSLTGISMEIETAARLGAGAPPDMARHLAVAMRTLKSCHTELRRCLWDLRSQALEETTMDNAIRRTLQPVVKANRLDVRFNVRRSQMPDDTAHMVLRIIRELVSNAIAHGHADRIRVAGGLDGERLVYSVRDNGCGFDPGNCPGVLQGHFGLQGIRERLSRFKGTLDIERNADGGTRVAVAMNLKEEGRG